VQRGDNRVLAEEAQPAAVTTVIMVNILVFGQFARSARITLPEFTTKWFVDT
jgi:hypothetical protein